VRQYRWMNFLQQVGFKNIYASKIGQFSLENAVSFSDETGNCVSNCIQTILLIIV